jgi:hypothetical protein
MLAISYCARPKARAVALSVPVTRDKQLAGPLQASIGSVPLGLNLAVSCRVVEPCRNGHFVLWNRSHTNHVVCRLVTITSSEFEFAARVFVHVNDKCAKWLSQVFEVVIWHFVPNHYLEHACWLEFIVVPACGEYA